MSKIKKRIRETLKTLRENRSTHAPRVTHDRGHIKVGSGGGRLKKGFRSSGAPRKNDGVSRNGSTGQS